MKSDLFKCSEPPVNETVSPLLLHHGYLRSLTALLLFGPRCIGVTVWYHQDDAPCHPGGCTPLLGEWSSSPLLNFSRKLGRIF